MPRRVKGAGSRSTDRRGLYTTVVGGNPNFLKRYAPFGMTTGKDKVGNIVYRLLHRPFNIRKK